MKLLLSKGPNADRTDYEFRILLDDSQRQLVQRIPRYTNKELDHVFDSRAETIFNTFGAKEYYNMAAHTNVARKDISEELQTNYTNGQTDI